MSFLTQIMPGESANAVPHYHKLCSRVSHIWGNRRGQHIRSAMDKPRPGKTTFVIMVSPLPGKYELLLTHRPAPSSSPHSARTVTSLAPPPHTQHLFVPRPGSSTRGTTSGTSACAHAGHRGPGGAGPAASARRSSTYATPPAGMPGFHGLPGWGAGPTNPPETRRCLVRGARGRVATRRGRDLGRRQLTVPRS